MARATTLTIAFSALVLLAQAQSLADYNTGAQEALDRDDECLLEGPEAPERCALNAAQLRLTKRHALAKAAEEAAKAQADAAPANKDGEQQWPFWPSGGATTQQPQQAFQQLGTGGCSTVYQKYPEAIASTTGVQSQWDCERQCTTNWVCQAYEYCGPYSNCQGSCKLFSGQQQVSSTNGYPGVTCYVRGSTAQPSQQAYKQIGQGGCTTPYNKYPEGTDSTGQSPLSCKAQCDQNPDCGAYEICQGSNCDGNCKWFSAQQHITGTNGYPGVSCYTKAQPYAMAEVAEARAGAKSGEAEAKAAEASSSADKAEGGKFWPFGSKYHQVGSGGCANAYNKYPDSYQSLTNVRSAEDCSQKCDDTGMCQAYEYCSGSNCDGNCKLFTSAAGITTSNSYPGVSCFSKGGGLGLLGEGHEKQQEGAVAGAASAAKEEEEGKAAGSFWPFGSKYHQVGSGGCANAYNKYPDSYQSLTNVRSAEQCSQRCDDSWMCQAYEYCSGSNCNGNCKLFAGAAGITTSNSYPGVSCFSKSSGGGGGGLPQPVYKVVGSGGCKTAYNQYPQGTSSSGQSASGCEAQCNRNSDCSAYEFCQGSNCNGNCKWYSSSQNVIGGNGYAGVTCYKKQGVLNLEQDAAAEAKAVEVEAGSKSGDEAAPAASSSEEQGSKLWPFGSKYHQVGNGGCANAYNKYPDSYQSLTNVRSAEACSQRCEDSWICQAYEYCSGSNCDGNCKLFNGNAGISTSNGYKGVTCFSKGGGGGGGGFGQPVYKEVGDGGCKTVYSQYPEGTESKHQSSSSCEALCNQNPSCSAYEFCKGSNCNGNCKWYSNTQKVIGGNGYKGVTCYVKQTPFHLAQTGAEAAEEGQEKQQGAVAGAGSGEEAGKAAGEWWPFGPRYQQIGTGGCAATGNQYPKGFQALTGIESAEACGKKCDWAFICEAYEFCTGSNCQGNCKLFSKTDQVTASNGYPGVACYALGGGAGHKATYKAVGTGGCGTASNNYPSGTASKGQTAATCEEQCTKNDQCGAYEICEGSNCNGNCQWYTKSQTITKANGYAGVTCYVKA